MCCNAQLFPSFQFCPARSTILSHNGASSSSLTPPDLKTLPRTSTNHSSLTKPSIHLSALHSISATPSAVAFTNPEVPLPDTSQTLNAHS
ncbi:hypothetical protein BT69DRAFT_1277709 [Atractiella rhizophila]|nr:hypothetical protein BT69DRAFT_1277709 [Atractiella rhizophila]